MVPSLMGMCIQCQSIRMLPACILFYLHYCHSVCISCLQRLQLYLVPCRIIIEVLSFLLGGFYDAINLLRLQGQSVGSHLFSRVTQSEWQIYEISCKSRWIVSLGNSLKRLLSNVVSDGRHTSKID